MKCTPVHYSISNFNYINFIIIYYCIDFNSNIGIDFNFNIGMDFNFNIFFDFGVLNFMKDNYIPLVIIIGLYYFVIHENNLFKLHLPDFIIKM